MATVLTFTKIATGVETDMNSASVITAKVNGVESTPANIIDSIQLSRRDGKKKLGDQHDERPIVLEGIFKADTPAALRSLLDQVKRDVSGDGMLDVTFEGEESAKRYFVTVTNIMVPNEAYQLDHVPFNLEMIAMDPPFGEDVDYISLLSVSGINNDLDQSNSLGGSAAPAFNLEVAIPTVGNLEGIEFRNDQTNTGLLMEATFVANDTVVIDTGRSSCLLNGSPANFSGQVPEFIAGDNDWSLNFLTDSVTIDVQQTSYTTERLVYGTTFIAQSFVPSGSISTQRIDAMLAKLGNPTSVKLSLYTNSSGAPGSAIAGATATVAGSTVPNTPAYISFRLQNVTALSSATTYWIVIEVTGAVNDVNNGVYWKASALAPYANGSASRSSNSGSSWTAVSALDMVFRTWKASVLVSNTDTSQETYTETFSATTNRDAGATTADWNTGSSKVILGT